MDTEGRKVIRVNDIQLLRTGQFVHVVAVDVSSNAILRRVGLAKVGERLAKSRQHPKPHLIDWKDVDLEQTDQSSVRLTVPSTKLELLHPADIADLVHELSPEERAAVLDALGGDLAADTFEELHSSFQASLLLEMPDEKAAELLANMSPDDAADLLADLPDDRRRHFIAMMKKEDAEDMRELLSYPEHSAGGIMTPDFAWVRLEATAAEALESLRAQSRGRGDRVLHLRAGQLRAPARRHLAARPAAGHAARTQGARLHDRAPCGGAHRRLRRGGHASSSPSTTCWPCPWWTSRTSSTASSPSTTPSTSCFRSPGRSACRGSSIEEASMAQSPRHVGRQLAGRIGRGRLMLMLAIIGPGLIAAASDNDAGGVTTWSVIGSRYGYSLLWLLLLITPILGVTQEMGARMGAVTGKGLAALIREKFSLRITALAMLALLVANFGTTLAEFSGVAAAFSLAHIPAWLAVPPVAFAVWFLVTRGSYRKVERVFLVLTAIYIAYFVAGFLAQSGLGPGAARHRGAACHGQQPLAAHRDRRHRHHHHALGPVLHPGLRGGQAHRHHGTTSTRSGRCSAAPCSRTWWTCSSCSPARRRSTSTTSS